MLRSSDVSNTLPEETTMVLYCALLSARLVDAGNDSRAASRIQRCWRSILAARYAAAVRGSAVLIQRIARGYLGRAHARKRASAIIKAQSWGRRAACVREFTRTRRSVVLVQSIARMRSARAAMEGEMAVCRALRMGAAKSDARVQLVAERRAARLLRAVVVTQSMWRGRVDRLHCKAIRAAVMIQKIYKGYKAITEFKQDMKSIVMTQAVARGLLVRRSIAQQSAASIKMQTAFRCFRQAKAYRIAHARLVKLQAAWRCYSAHKAFSTLKAASVTMQSMWRGRVARLHCKAIRAAVMIQKIYKGYCDRAAFKQDIKSIVATQAVCKGWVVRKMIAQQTAACVKIQARFRAYTSRCTFLRTVTGFAKAQAIARGMIARSMVREMRRQARIAGCVVQLQCWARTVLAKMASARRTRSIAVIQAMFRGCLARKRLLTSCKQLAIKARNARKRITEARKKVQEHMTLGNRTNAGLETLLHCQTITPVIKAVGSLEVATRWSDVCARCIVDLDAIEKIYSVISSCNRSKPHIELSKVCLATLVNFTKYKNLFRGDLARPTAASVLSAFIQQMRDTDEECVHMAVKVMRFIAQDQVIAAEISMVQGTSANPSPLQRLNLALKSLKNKALAPSNGGRGKESACVKALDALIKTISTDVGK